MCPQFVIAASLLGFHVAVKRLLSLFGEIFDDLLFSASENEWSENFGQQGAVCLLEGSTGADVLLEHCVTA